MSSSDESSRPSGTDISQYSGLVKGVAQAPGIAAEDLKVMFDTNVTGLINMTQAILPIFKARSEGGRGDIINIGSIAGREPYPGGSIYCATKAAVRSFTDALRKELIATRIRVIEIDPGQVETVCLHSLPTVVISEDLTKIHLGVLRCALLWRPVQGRCRLQVRQSHTIDNPTTNKIQGS